ncbi:MAG: winged helix DNA-binding domain-containing protein, partial [Pseudonocardia sp.]|nr:winged helix DNA-binding domain-containing protein [Pseudonocardia sp.]
MAARRTTSATVRASDVIAFRLHAHHLTSRQPFEDLHEVAGACGVQDSPPGSALLALHARVEDVTRDRVDHLVGEEKSLLQTWCMRGSPFFFPTVDAPVFTAGALPATEKARLHLIIGIDHAL